MDNSCFNDLFPALVIRKINKYYVKSKLISVHTLLINSKFWWRKRLDDRYLPKPLPPPYVPYNNTNPFRLNFNHPIKELFWVVQNTI